MGFPFAVVLGAFAPFDAIGVFGGFPPELLILRVGADVGDRLVALGVCHARRPSRTSLRRHLPTLLGVAGDGEHHRPDDDGRDAASGATGADVVRTRARPTDRPALVVSACLLGVPCNHRGGASPSAAVAALGNEHRLVPVCPEVAGGLTTPRVAAERQPDGRVVNAAGDDVTEAYERGASHAVALARAAGAQRAVLKARSPSCGCAGIYDGTFTRTLTGGEGVTAQALRSAGIEVCSEEELELRRPRPAAGGGAGSSAAGP